MIAICNDDPWVIGLHGDHHWFGGDERVYIPAIDHGRNFQKTQEYLVLTLEYYMIRGSNNVLI